MLSTVDRYLVKEIALTFAATVAVLLMALLSHRLSDLLSQAASGILAKNAILALLGLKAIGLLGPLLPPALLLSIMIALGRLYRDSEMVALSACGLGPGAIYRSIFWLAIPIAAMVAALTLLVVPYSMELQYQLINQARKEAEITVFNPGTFREIADGEHTVYVGSLTDQGASLSDIFIRSRTGQGVAVTTADKGYQQIDNELGARYIVLDNGARYEGQPGQEDYSSVSFERLTVRIDSVPQDAQRLRRRAIPTTQLLASDNPKYHSELHERLGSPVAVILLAVLAPLLARANPREGRYSRVVAAVLIYTVYFNLLAVGQAWLKRALVPPALGLWWAHGLLLLLCLVLWLAANPPRGLLRRTKLAPA